LDLNKIILNSICFFFARILPPKGTPAEVNRRHCDLIIFETAGLVISTDIFACSLGANEPT